MTSNKYKSTARIVGGLFLMQIFLGVFIKQFLLGTESFRFDFIKTAATQSNYIVLVVLLAFLLNALSFIITILLLPIFKKYSESIAYGFFGISIITFMIGAFEEVSILSLLSFSQEYIQSETLDASYIHFLGNVFQKIHWWSHYLALLFPCFPFFLLFFLFEKTRLIPRFISWWGFIAALLMFLAVLLAIFGQGTFMILFLPLGLNQLFLGVWLLVKGFNQTTEKFQIT